MSTNDMSYEPPERSELLQGTLDMPVLLTPLCDSPHGNDVARHNQRTTDDLLKIEHDSLNPAMHRLQRKSWLADEREPAKKTKDVSLKYCRLTATRRKQLLAEESRWKQITGSIARVMWPVKEN